MPKFGRLMLIPKSTGMTWTLEAPFTRRMPLFATYPCVAMKDVLVMTCKP